MEKTIETLKEACRRIQHGLIQYRHQTETAAALIWEAKTKEVWKGSYSSWTEFCEKGCGYTRRWANELFNKYQVKVNFEQWGQLSQSGKSLPASEGTFLGKSQKKCLSSEQSLTVANPGSQRRSVFNPDERPRDYSGAYFSDNGKPESNGTPHGTNGEPKDHFGIKITSDGLPYWMRRDEFDYPMKLASELKCWAEKQYNKQGEGDRLFAQMNLQEVILKCQSIHYQFASAKPMAVCLGCKGMPSLNKACDPCCTTGIVGKDRWKKFAKEEKVLWFKFNKVEEVTV